MNRSALALGYELKTHIWALFSHFFLDWLLSFYSLLCHSTFSIYMFDFDRKSVFAYAGEKCRLKALLESCER